MDLRSDVAMIKWIKWIILIIRFVLTPSQEPHSVCQTEQLEARCRGNEVVMMTSALYGRMRFGRCVDKDYGFVGCEDDVLAQADALCSGRRECTIGIPNAVFEGIVAKCPRDLKLYLEATYKCLPVISTNEFLCSLSNGGVRLTSASGLIASVYTEETELGSVKCPWLIQAGRRQKINVTLFDFGTAQAASHGISEPCQAYAVIRERQTTRTVTVCAGAERLRHVLLSEHEQLEVRIQPSQNRNRTRSFLLQYEFVGCADPEFSDRNFYLVRRTEGQLEIGCTSSDRRWTLTCTGSTWSGQPGNCTDPALSEKYDEMKMAKGDIPWGASIVAVSVIALTLAIIILIAGLMIIRCHRQARLSDTLPENVYYGEAAKRHMASGVPVSADLRPESLHRSNLENEYSYIGEMMMDPGCVPVRRSHDYGTTEVTTAYDSPCSAGEVDRKGVFRPSAYFELEPQRRAEMGADTAEVIVRCYRQPDGGIPAECGGSGFQVRAVSCKPGSAASVYFNDDSKDLSDNYKSV